MTAPIDRPIMLADVRALRAEAAETGDVEQVVLCQMALLGDRDAWDACERVILAARAAMTQTDGAGVHPSNREMRR